MLRIARIPLRARRTASSLGARQMSGKPPASTPGGPAKPNAMPVNKAAAAPSEVDGAFRTKVTAFIVIQGIVLAIFGVAHKMEDDDNFAKKIEGYYDVTGVRPTLEAFRGIVRVIQPPVKKDKKDAMAPPAIKIADPPKSLMVEESVSAAPSGEGELNQQGEEEHDESVTVRHEMEVFDQTGGEEEPATEVRDSGADVSASATATAPEAAVSGVSPRQSNTAQSNTAQDEEHRRKIESLEQKLALFEAESAAIRERIQASEAAQEAEVQRQRELATILPAVDAEARARDVKITTSEAVLEEMSRHAIKTRQDLQHSLLQDLHELSEGELRLRIQQLAAEFFERTKWEGLRLHDSLKQLEEELTSKYTKLLQEQRAQLQVELDRALIQREKDVTAKYLAEKAAMEKKHEESVASAVKAQAAGFHESQVKQLEEETEKLKQAFTDEYNLQLSLMKNDQVKQLVRISDDMELIKAEIAEYRKVVDSITQVQRQTRDLNAESAAILGLEAALSTSTPLYSVVDALKKSYSDNELLVAALSAIPTQGLKQGIPTLPELKLRFKVVRKEVRRASLIPDNVPNFLGQVVGTALASIPWSPTESEKVDPTASAEDKDVEDHLASIAYYLEGGRMDEALKVAENISGYPRMLMQDWENGARNRMFADKVVQVLKSYSALKYQRLAKA